jgi:hypothetical protein
MWADMSAVAGCGSARWAASSAEASSSLWAWFDDNSEPRRIALCCPALGLADAVARLSLLPWRSWLLIASSTERLIETVGQETTNRLLAVAEQAEHALSLFQPHAEA